jgi:hypothetical protein
MGFRKTSSDALTRQTAPADDRLQRPTDTSQNRVHTAQLRARANDQMSKLKPLALTPTSSGEAIRTPALQPAPLRNRGGAAS